MNFHALVRDALEPFRDAHPDLVVELEHRGEGDGKWDEAALLRELAAVFERAFATASGDAGCLWFRSDGRADDEVLLKMEIGGLETTGPKIVLRRPRYEP